MKSSRMLAAVGATGVLLATAACTNVEKTGGTATSAAQSAASQAGASGATPSSPSASDSMPAQSSPSSATPTESTDSTDSSADAGGDQTGLVNTKVGQEAKTSKLSVKVNKVVDPVPTDSSSIFKPSAGKHWAAVNMSVTNIGSEKINFSPMFCTEAKTNTNARATNALVAHYGSPMESGDLQKGDTTVGDVVFELPTDQKLTTLDVRCTLSFQGDQRTIRVNLAQ